jgi:predicted ester cyclase
VNQVPQIVASAVFPDNVIWHDVSNPQPLEGKEAIGQYLEGWFSAFPDIKITVTNRVVTEDQVAAELDFTGTNSSPLQLAPGAPAIPATGKKVHARGTYFVRFKGGKPVEVHSYPDAAGMMQLGLMPMPGS